MKSNSITYGERLLSHLQFMRPGNQFLSRAIEVTSLGVFFLFLIICVKPAFLEERGPVIIDYFSPSPNPQSLFYPPKILRKFSKRKFLSIELNGDKEDEIKMEIIRYEAVRIKYRNDTTEAIKVHLGEKMIYKTFIELLNMMMKDGHDRYFEWNDWFYIIFEKRISKVEEEVTLYYL